MSVRRLVFCVVAVAAICLANVYYRARAVQYGYELGSVHGQSDQLRTSIASLEARVTALGSPARLLSQNDKFQLGLVGPSKWQQAPTALASASVDDSERGLVRR